MGRESRRDVDHGGRRHRRRAAHQHDSDDSPPEPRMMRHPPALAPAPAPAPAPEPSQARTLPHRGKLQLSRFDDGAMRGNAAATSPSSSSISGSSSLDATEATLPPPPPSPPRLTRAQTVAYGGRPRDRVVYDDDRLALARLRRSRTQVSPDDRDRRPRQASKIIAVSSSESSASVSVDSLDEKADHHSSDEHDDDNDDDDDDDEYDYKDQILDTIEVTEEADDEASRERKAKHTQRTSHVGYREHARHHRSRRTKRSPSNETRPRRRHHHSADEHKPLTRRSSPTPSDVDGSPLAGRRRKVASLVEGPRPPVTSHRASRHRKTSAEIVHHETPPGRSNTVASGRSSTRSSSRRTPSILGSFFGSAPPPRTSPGKPAKLVECIICMGNIRSHRAPKLKCGHRMCHACLQRIFELSVTDPRHMPPRCCTQDYIPLKHVESLFNVSFKKTWNRKFTEYSTRNRIYCPAKKCGEWIKPANIRKEDGRKVARCGRCKTKVCGACNSKWHSSAECPRDEETNQFLRQAKEEGWQRCFNCKAMVELKEGCNHMTCRCGAEFCMICGTKWKNCDCPWFNYETLDAEHLMHAHTPGLGIRGDMRDIFTDDGPPMPSELRGLSGFGPLPGPMRAGTYEGEMHLRRVQEQRDADLARRMQLYDESDDDDHDRRRVASEVLGAGSSAGHSMNEEYRRPRRRMTAPTAPSPPPAAPTMYDRGPDYVSDVNRARGLRATSQERRLADRFSESRYVSGPRPGMGSPISPHGFSPMSPIRPPPVGHPPMLGPMPMVMPMAMPAPPPVPMSMMPPHPMYHTPPDLMMGARMVHPYEGDFEAHALRSRRPGREELEAPKSSTLAGLTGPGSGMDRVYEWRHFVEPGAPDNEAIAG